MIHQKIEEISIGEIDNALRNCLSTICRNERFFQGVFPNQTAESGVYGENTSIQQLSGLWTGEMWLSFGLTSENCFREGAEKLLPYFSEYSLEMEKRSAENAGVLFSPSCVAAWKSVKNKSAHESALRAADALVANFRPKGQFIQMSGKDGGPHDYCFSLESLMALPLLFWARDETGRQEYRDVAKAHFNTVVNNCVTADGAVFGKFFMNPADGHPVAGSSDSEYTGQTVHAYMQAVALLGVALCYRYDRQNDSVNSFRRLFSFYVSRLPPDRIPYWDMNVQSGDDADRDSAAAAIAACALLQMSENYCSGVPDDETFTWRRTARCIMKVLSEKYAVRDYAKSNGLLYSGSVRNENQCTLRGDYFYLEALCRLRSSHFVNYW
jgi:unsaturated chondroitin disaccharide hydrolase